MGGAIASLYASRYSGTSAQPRFHWLAAGRYRLDRRNAQRNFSGYQSFIPINVRQRDLELRLLFVTPPSISDAEKRDIVAMYVANNRHYVQVWNIVNLYDDVLWRRPIPKLPTLIIWGIDDRIFGVNWRTAPSARGPRKRASRVTACRPFTAGRKRCRGRADIRELPWMPGYGYAPKMNCRASNRSRGTGEFCSSARFLASARAYA